MHDKWAYRGLDVFGQSFPIVHDCASVDGLVWNTCPFGVQEPWGGGRFSNGANSEIDPDGAITSRSGCHFCSLIFSSGIRLHVGQHRHQNENERDDLEVEAIRQRVVCAACHRSSLRVSRCHDTEWEHKTVEGGHRKVERENEDAGMRRMSEGGRKLVREEEGGRTSTAYACALVVTIRTNTSDFCNTNDGANNHDEGKSQAHRKPHALLRVIRPGTVLGKQCGEAKQHGRKCRSTS